MTSYSPEHAAFGDAIEHGDISGELKTGVHLARVQVCTPTASGSYWKLPPASLFNDAGMWVFQLINESASESMDVQDDGGTVVGTIGPLEAGIVDLIDNSDADGEWIVSARSIGVAPGSPVSSQIIVMGGGGNATGRFRAWDPDSGSWSVRTDPPTTPTTTEWLDAPAFGLAGRAYIVSSDTSSSDLLELDAGAGDVWTVRTAINGRTFDPFCGGEDVAGLGYIFGGDQVSGYTGLRLVQSYDRGVDAWTLRPAMLDDDEQYGVASLSTSCYLHGGGDTINEESTVVRKFDHSSQAWSLDVSSPAGTDIYSQAFGRYGTRLHSVGGRDPFFSDQHLAFDPASGVWTSLSDYPEPVSHNGAHEIGSILIVPGGDKDDVISYSASFRWDSIAWVAIADLPGAEGNTQYFFRHGVIVIEV